MNAHSNNSACKNIMKRLSNCFNRVSLFVRIIKYAKDMIIYLLTVGIAYAQNRLIYA